MNETATVTKKSDAKKSTRLTRTRHASRNRREQGKQELREVILEEASKEFSEHGYEKFSLRRVAERIGYTPTTIYLYFKNKDELLLAAVQDGFTHFDEAIAAAAKGPRGPHTPLKRIEALGRAYIQFGLDHPALYRLMFMQRSDFYFMPRLMGRGSLEPKPDQQTSPVQHRAVAQELLIAAVEEGIAQKLIARQNAVQAADALWAGVHGVVALATSPLMTREQAEAVGEQLLRLLIQGLKPQPKR